MILFTINPTTSTMKVAKPDVATLTRIAGEVRPFRNTLRNTLRNTQNLDRDVTPCIPRMLPATAGPDNDTQGGHTKSQNLAHRAALADAMAVAMADAMAVARADAIAAANAVAIAAANAVIMRR